MTHGDEASVELAAIARPPSERLIAPGSTLVVVAAVALLLALVVIGAAATWHHGSPIAAETRLADAVDRLGVGRGDWGSFASYARNTVVPIVTVGLAVLFAVGRRWRALAACAAVPLTVFLVESVLKPVIGRTVGTQGVYSYPSGQAAASAALATIVVVLLASRTPNRVARTAVACLALVGMASVGLAIVGSRSHFALDAVGGAAFGIAFALAWCLLVDAVADRVEARPRH
ncbi:MAG: hypothetical protein U0V73_07790 [Acidimicrobiia bacterium]